MSLEQLDDYFSTSYKKTFLGKIYLSHKIQEAIKKEIGQDVRVVVGLKEIKIFCNNNLVSQVVKSRSELINDKIKEIIIRQSGK